MSKIYEHDGCEECKYYPEEHRVICARCRRTHQLPNDSPDLFSPCEEAIQEYDAINPSHYCRVGAIECIDEMEMVFGPEETAIFCKLNTWKYRYRAADKNELEDLEKSDWYMRKYQELKQKIDGIKHKDVIADMLRR